MEEVIWASDYYKKNKEFNMTKEEDKAKADEVEKRKKELEEEQKKLDKEQAAKATKEKEEHPDDKISRAEAAAERLEAANKVSAQQLEEQRAIAVSNKLGGESAAGSILPEEKEETPEEYKDRVMAGEVEDEK